jgi:hypothetical protein
MAPGIRLKRSFAAKNSKGETKELREYVNVINIPTRANPDHEQEAMGFFQTADGKSVNPTGKGKYEIVETREILTADDADLS